MILFKTTLTINVHYKFCHTTLWQIVYMNFRIGKVQDNAKVPQVTTMNITTNLEEWRLVSNPYQRRQKNELISSKIQDIITCFALSAKYLQYLQNNTYKIY